MPTRKIRDIDPCDKRFNPCRHPAHDPPSMMVYQPGEYEHECPACGNIVRFTVYPKHMVQAEKHVVKAPKPVKPKRKPATDDDIDEQHLMYNPDDKGLWSTG